MPKGESQPFLSRGRLARIDDPRVKRYRLAAAYVSQDLHARVMTYVRARRAKQPRYFAADFVAEAAEAYLAQVEQPDPRTMSPAEYARSVMLTDEPIFEGEK